MKANTKRLLGSATAAITILGMISWMGPSGYYEHSVENDFLASLKKKQAAYNEQLPEDRVYLQLDKPFYKPGETVWFNAFVRNGADMKPSQKSDILHVDLINPKGGIEKSIKLIARNGRAAGDLALGAEAPGGLYKVKAYTNWMKNEGDTNVFEKQIQVQEIILPKLKMKLDFERKAFGAGDEVVAKVELNTNENKPLSNRRGGYQAKDDRG